MSLFATVARGVGPVRFLQHSANLFTQSHCRSDFLLRCHELTTDGGGEWLVTSLMSLSTGAPAQKKRALSRIKWMIRSPKTRCCGSLRTMSVLLRGPRIGPLGAYQID